MGQAIFPGESDEDNLGCISIVGFIITAFFMVPKLGWVWGIITSLIWPFTVLFYIGKWLIEYLF